MNKDQITALIEKLAFHTPKCRECGDIAQYTLQSVYIGDVLEKMKDLDVSKRSVNGSVFRSDFDLISMWRPCGFSKSLQEVCEESGWVEMGDVFYEDGHPQWWLEDKNARALFEFLNDIFK